MNEDDTREIMFALKACICVIFIFIVTAIVFIGRVF